MTEKVGLLGWPVAHSVSPAMHNAAFAALGLDWQYDLLPVPPGDLVMQLGRLLDAGYRGFNVTVPHKHAVMSAPHIAEVDPVAREIGAVNTLGLHPEGGLSASNTDWRGFSADLAANAIRVEGSDCIVLGTGGSSRAVTFALRRGGARRVHRVSRAPDDSPDVLGYDELEAVIDDGDNLLIVNCTPLGMHPNIDASPWPEGLPFPGRATLVDLIYNPPRTRLMSLAEDAGARTLGGLGMLVRQGALAFETWTDIAPPIDVMARAAREALGLSEHA